MNYKIRKYYVILLKVNQKDQFIVTKREREKQ